MEQTIHILVVDDEPDIRRILHIMLEHQGYRVHEAINGRRAVEYIRENPDTDLILMDIMMPELGGVEASREIRVDLLRADPVPDGQEPGAGMLQAYRSGRRRLSRQAVLQRGAADARGVAAAALSRL